MARLVDPNILTSVPIQSYLRTALDGYRAGEKNVQNRRDMAYQDQTRTATLKDYANKSMEEARQRDAQRLFNEVAKGRDISTAEGFKPIVDEMTKRGYGKEATELWAHVAPIFEKKQQATPPKPDVIYDKSGNAFALDPVSMGLKPLQLPTGDPLQKYVEPQQAKQAAEPDVIRVPGQVPYQVVGGVYRPIKGAPIVPRDVKEPKPIEPPKPLSGDAAKLVSIAYTLPQDVEGLKAAFIKDFKGSIAGLSSGTSPNLEKLKSQIADKLGRLRSGGAVNSDEMETFDALISKVKDLAFTDVNDAVSTLDDIAYEAKIIMEGVDPDESFRKRLKGKGLEYKPSSRVPESGSGPKVGSVEDGYRFKGGNPADPKSWEKVK